MYNLENYEIIFEIMRRYLKSRKNEILIIKLSQIEFFYLYQRFIYIFFCFFFRLFRLFFCFFRFFFFFSFFSFFISKAQTKSNEFINIKKLLINITKFSNKTRKKRYIKRKFKTKKKRIKKWVEKHWYEKVFGECLIC